MRVLALDAVSYSLTTKGKAVHIVDDDPAVCASLKFALELEGYCVHTHASGQELLKDRRLRTADCVILDYRMPGMDGLAVMSKLASRAIAAPVILMTAPVNDALRRRAARQGIFALLEKPLLDNVLVEHVREAVSA